MAWFYAGEAIYGRVGWQLLGMARVEKKNGPSVSLSLQKSARF
jgi:hypothetical protein